MKLKVLNFPISQTRNWIPLVPNKIKFIVVHHAKARHATPEDINKWHLVDNKWSGGFGYNEYIRKDGTVYIGRGDNVGAQCAGYNSVSYGICCEGDFSVEPEMTDAQFKSLVERVAYHMDRFEDVRLMKHSQLYSTTCPAQNFPWKELVDEVAYLKVLNNKYLVPKYKYLSRKMKRSKFIHGSVAQTMILRFAVMFKNISTFNEALQVLVDMGVLRTPAYWKRYARFYSRVRSRYLKKLMIDMSKHLR